MATNAAHKLHVPGQDGHALSVDGAQVDVLEQRDEVSLRCLLQCHDGVALKAQIGLEFLRHFAHKALEGLLANEHVGRLLVRADLAERNRARTHAVLLDNLHATLHLRSNFLSQSLVGRLAGELLCDLLCACHCCCGGGVPRVCILLALRM